MKKISVLFVMEAIGGGTKKVLELLANNLDTEKIDISILVPKIKANKLRPLADSNFAESLRRKGHKVIEIEMLGGQVHLVKDFVSIIRISKIIKNHKFDIVHGISVKGGTLGRIAARIAGNSKVVYSPEGLSFNPYVRWIKRKLYQSIERCLGITCTDLFVACSESEMEQAQSARLVSPSKIVVIENCLDTENYDVTSVNVLAKKQELCIPSSVPVIGMVSRLVPQKGIQYFIQVCALINQTIPDCQFILVGEGEESEKTTKLIESLSLNNVFHMLGARSDYLEIISTYDVFVMTSLWEGLPYAPLEAMLLRKPVVAFKVTGCVDIVQHNITGYLADTIDSTSMSSSIIRLLRSPERREKMGLAGENLTRRRFSAQSNALRFEKAYEELVKSK